MELKELRKKAKLTQESAATFFNISLRSYQSYENDNSKKKSLKYQYMIQEFEKLTKIDESHGILEINDIIHICKNVLKDYPITYCYLFGSYAKATANEKSDIDLLVSSEVRGLKFYGLVESLKSKLKKNVDVLSSAQLLNNPELLDEILKDGIKIYG